MSMLIDRLWLDVGDIRKDDAKAANRAKALGWVKSQNRATKFQYVCKAYDYCDLAIVLKRKAPAVDYVFLVDKKLALGNIEYLTRKINFEKEHNDDANADRVLYLKEDIQPLWPRERTLCEKGQMVTKSGLETLLRIYHGTVNLKNISDEDLIHTRALADAWTIDTVRDAMDEYFKHYKLEKLETMCRMKKLNIEQEAEEAYKAKLFELAKYVILYMNNLAKNEAQFGDILKPCIKRVQDLLGNEVVGYVVLREADRQNLIPLLYPNSPGYAQPKPTTASARKRAKRHRSRSKKLALDQVKRPKHDGDNSTESKAVSDCAPVPEKTEVSETQEIGGDNLARNVISSQEQGSSGLGSAPQ